MADMVPPGQQRRAEAPQEPQMAPASSSRLQTMNTPTIALPPTDPVARSGHLSLDTFSPVNQNGSFAFDRVLKSGEVHKRTRKTKQWKSFYLVLRPNLVSLYKSPTEERLLKQISLCDLTAVAYLKDPKGRRENIFGLYSPARNWHLQAKSAEDARQWVELIKQEAKIDEEEHDLYMGSPTGHDPLSSDLARFERPDPDRFASSSPEPPEVATSRLSLTTRDGIKIPRMPRSSAHYFEYSGDDLAGTYSDFSDSASQSQGPSLPFGSPRLGRLRQLEQLQQQQRDAAAAAASGQPSQHSLRPLYGRNHSQASGVNNSVEPTPQDNISERVIRQGYMLYLRSKGGVRQWRRTWAVLRPRNIAFYKNEDEYAAKLILPLSQIISAVEIDPISRSKKHCIQIIAEDKSYRFCAASEDDLAEWLGAIKSQLVKRSSHPQSISTPGTTGMPPPPPLPQAASVPLPPSIIPPTPDTTSGSISPARSGSVAVAAGPAVLNAPSPIPEDEHDRDPPEREQEREKEREKNEQGQPSLHVR